MTRSAHLGIPDNLPTPWVAPCQGLWEPTRTFSPEEKLLVELIVTAPSDFRRLQSRIDTYLWVTATPPQLYPFCARAIAVGSRLATLDKSAKVRIISAALQSDDKASVATLLSIPSEMDVFSDLDSRMIDLLRDKLVDLTDPKARPEVAQTAFALGRTRLAKEILQRRIAEAGVQPKPGSTVRVIGVRGAA